MKNRIWNQTVRLVAAGILFTMAVCGKWGQTVEIKASNVDHEGLKLVQTAKWIEEEPWKAELSMEVKGLLAYREQVMAQQQAPGGTEEPPKEEHVEGVTEEGAEAAAVSEEILPETEEEAFDQEVQDRADEVYGYSEEQVELPLEEENSWETEIITEEYPEEEAARSVFEEGYEEAPEGGAGNPSVQLFLENYISEYFVPVREALPGEGWMEEVKTVNQKGEETILYKVVYPVNLLEITEDTLSIPIQAVLREEYRYPAQLTRYPLSQDDPLKKDCEGPGLRLTMTRGVESVVLAQGETAVLEVKEGVADFDVKLKARTPEVKAGNPCSYELLIRNTGSLPLKDIRIKSTLEKEWKEEVNGAWDETEGVVVQGKEGLIPLLEQGKELRLFFTAMLGEEAQGRLVHKVKVQAPCPKAEGEILGKEAVAETRITPLKADFTVEKTADRTQAYPGDTITYQICIRNTGERTLHSVLSTERFLGAGVQARFQPKEGVTLNASGTQALIDKIAPGAAVALQAVVTLPSYMTSGELINQVVVVSKETGTRNYESQSKVQVAQPVVTATPTPMVYNGYQVDYQSGSLGKSAYMAATQPKTGDDTRIWIFVVLLGGAALSAAGIFWRLKGKSKD